MASAVPSRVSSGAQRQSTTHVNIERISGDDVAAANQGRAEQRACDQHEGVVPPDTYLSHRGSASRGWAKAAHHLRVTGTYRHSAPCRCVRGACASKRRKLALRGSPRAHDVFGCLCKSQMHSAHAYAPHSNTGALGLLGLGLHRSRTPHHAPPFSRVTPSPHVGHPIQGGYGRRAGGPCACP